MTDILSSSPTKDLLNKLAGLDNNTGDERLKRIVQRVVSDAFRTIEDFDVTPAEFWTAMGYLTALGKSNEVGLLAPGLGFEHFFDLLIDKKEQEAGLKGGTPRTIEGPLYLSDAPLSKGEARLDDGSEQGEVLFMEGQVRDTDGNPIPGAMVDVWHANTMGGYSFFDPSQQPWNLRRRIEADGEGRYRFRTILPAGYGCPPDGTTQQLLTALGRHGRRPAHVHFFVSAPGYRQLTTQINIAGDEYLHDDFAFATRDELIPAISRRADAAGSNIPASLKEGLNAPYSEITFDFALNREVASLPDTVVIREHAKAA